MGEDGLSLLVYHRDYLGDIPQSFIHLLFTIDFILDLFLLTHTQLTTSFIQYLLESCLFLGLYLFLEILLSLTLLLLPADDLSSLVEFLILSGPAVRQLDEVFGFALLTFGLVKVVAFGW